MSISNENNPCITVVGLGSITADLEVPAAYAAQGRVIKSVSVIDQAGIAASDTNYILLTLKNGATTIATLDSRAAANGALTANVAKALTLVVAAIAAGSTLTLDYDEEGTVAMTSAQLAIEWHAK